MGIIKTFKLIFDYIKEDEESGKSSTLRAIDGVDIDVEAGQFVAILGHNGSGKSTLAKHMNALLCPTEGTIWVDEIDTKNEEQVWTVRQTAGMVFQNPDNQIVGSMVEEDCGFGPENLGVPTEEIWKRVDHSLATVEMNAFRKLSPNTLSGGQKQRVAIAGVLAMKPKCIVLDEPTAMLDPSGRKEVIKTIRSLNKEEGMTVILITHYMEETVDADKIFVMDNGKIVLEGTPREVFSRVEQMKGWHLDVPYVTDLAYELRKKGFNLPDTILTREEFIQAVAKQNRAFSDAPVKKVRTEKILKDSDTVLELKDVCHVYGQDTNLAVYALKNVSLSIHKGEFIGLIGHTGSGKSTLIQHFDRLINATSGDILFYGESIYAEGFNVKKLRSKVGLVFQYPEHQLFEETVFADVCFGPKNLGLSEAEIKQRAENALELVGLDRSYYDASPFDLSGGQKRRVAIAGVLAMEPDVLILDEPTAGLDPLGRDDILNQVAKLQKEKGITVILVSHSMEDVAHYVDRIIVMNRGEKMYDDIPAHVFSHIRELEEMGLAAPEATYVLQGLKDAGVPVDTSAITMDEAVNSICNAFAGRN